MAESLGNISRDLTFSLGQNNVMIYGNAEEKCVFYNITKFTVIAVMVREMSCGIVALAG